MVNRLGESICNRKVARYVDHLTLDQRGGVVEPVVRCSLGRRTATMHLQGVPLGTCGQCLHPRLCSARTHSFTKRHHRHLCFVRNASSEAPASKSQPDLFKQLGQVCSEMNQAPPSVVCGITDGFMLCSFCGLAYGLYYLHKCCRDKNTPLIYQMLWRN